MNNFDFVEKFISGTKEKKLKWAECTGAINGRVYKQRNEYEQAFFVLRKGSVVLVTKKEDYDEHGDYTGNKYSLIILDSDLDELYRIDDSNLFDSDDDTSTVYYSQEKSLVLSRLFRLAERSAKNVDRLLEKLAEGLFSPSDELPF